MRAFKQNIENKEMASRDQLIKVKQLLDYRNVAQIRARLNNIILGKPQFVNKMNDLAA